MFKTLLFPPTDLLEKSDQYGKFKKEYIMGWMDVLQKAYPENWKNKDSLFKGHEAGLYSKENVRSLLMNLTSSYTAFCIIHKDVNEYLKKNNQNVITYGDNPNTNLLELRKFFSILHGLRSNIFKRGEQSNTLRQIGGVLKKTDCLGKRNEEATMKIINQNYGEGACKIVSGGGYTKDMLSGIDATITMDGQEHTSQIKPFKNIFEKDGYFVVQGSSSTQSYNKVSLLIFVNVKSKQVRIYKTPKIRIQQGSYYIPKENMVSTIFAKGELDLIDCNKYLSENIIWE